MKPISRLFRRRIKRTYNHKDSVTCRLSVAADRIIKATAVEYHLSFIGAAGLVCEKAVVKMAEEKAIRKLNPR